MVKRFGQFKWVDQPGLRVLRPFVDRMEKVDMREFPMTGDQQSVITKDNVSLWVSATIFCQVIDVKSALFEINDYRLAVDQLSRTALRAVFGELSLDQALSERETINSRMQDHMADATVKWGVRLNRIEILDITPPTNVIQAMSEQKEAEQHKKAAILKSEGEQQAAINSAGGRQQAAVLEAQGAKEAAILRAEAEMKVLELQAEGEKKASVLRGEGEAARLTSLDTATINPRTLAVLQLRALQEIAASNNAKVVVPYEAASLMGSAEVLLSTLKLGHLGLQGLAREAERRGSHHPLHLTAVVLTLRAEAGAGPWTTSPTTVVLASPQALPPRAADSGSCARAIPAERTIRSSTCRLESLLRHSPATWAARCRSRLTPPAAFPAPPSWGCPTPPGDDQRFYQPGGTEVLSRRVTRSTISLRALHHPRCSGAGSSVRSAPRPRRPAPSPVMQRTASLVRHRVV